MLYKSQDANFAVDSDEVLNAEAAYFPGAPHVIRVDFYYGLTSGMWWRIFSSRNVKR